MVQIVGDGLELVRGVGVHPAQDEELPRAPEGGLPGLGQKLRQPHLLGLPHHFGWEPPRDFSVSAASSRGQGPLHEELLIPVKEIEGLDGAAFQMAF